MSSPLRKSIFWLGFSFLFLGLIILGLSFWIQPQPGRTNLLVLGVSGGDHSGSDLTDSMIFISIENQTGETLILSLPRDIWIAPLRAKLNTVYHYQGLEETKKTVGEMLGQKVDYGIVVDFEIFKKVVDFLDGVEIEVERAFDDYKYPLPGKENDLCNGDKNYECRYEHLHFDVGNQIMNGEQALKYVRSRNAEGEEGTDFARSQRQQRLIIALQKKIFKPEIILKSKKIQELEKLFLENIKMDIPQEKYLDLIKVVLKLRKNKFQTAVLNDGYLINPPTSQAKYDNQWVLVPESGDWQAVQNHVNDLIDKF